mmetsp:Transcript_6532/g.4906  ORF Transcript_6532/g.4906 Transcript_6532/m.4906 type:complete len:89 (-) Transcript_6532:826-1092(-)
MADIFHVQLPKRDERWRLLRELRRVELLQSWPRWYSHKIMTLVKDIIGVPIGVLVYVVGLLEDGGLENVEAVLQVRTEVVELEHHPHP